MALSVIAAVLAAVPGDAYAQSNFAQTAEAARSFTDIDELSADFVADSQAVDSVEALASQAGSLCGDQSEIPVWECESLVALYESTNGRGWTNIGSPWLTNTPCSWTGVECSRGGHVKNLSLPSRNLDGPIPAELGNLAKLQVLSLRSNDLSGAIPAELGSLTNLQRINLNRNGLSGAIPAELG
ncbi:MAG: hypothetical protein V3V01_06390, partial [Acidimicrobiales bacterium]